MVLLAKKRSFGNNHHSDLVLVGVHNKELPVKLSRIWTRSLAALLGVGVVGVGVVSLQQTRKSGTLVPGRTRPTLQLKVDGPWNKPIHSLTLGGGCCFSRPVSPPNADGWIEVALWAAPCTPGKKETEIYPVRVSYVDPDVVIFNGVPEPGTWPCPKKRRSVR